MASHDPSFIGSGEADVEERSVTEADMFGRVVVLSFADDCVAGDVERLLTVITLTSNDC